MRKRIINIYGPEACTLPKQWSPGQEVVNWSNSPTSADQALLSCIIRGKTGLVRGSGKERKKYCSKIEDEDNWSQLERTSLDLAG